MTAQLALFPPTPATPRFNPDAVLAGFRPNLPGACCPHYRLQHRQVAGGVYGRCDFCDCDQYRET
ncbi:hypothetical protein C1Y40_04137 [Mycobacterium talmoniae]|uniref:Uncharacterized protein n=1 Tax=Mycobacterium talmoniae TaxID=1858794 RepID=A0A2S8BG93_9MYCO|nr:hypothetical protein C1Y40_04137 [Mycobacterium talmoniae]